MALSLKDTEKKTSTQPQLGRQKAQNSRKAWDQPEAKPRVEKKDPVDHYLNQWRSLNQSSWLKSKVLGRISRKLLHKAEFHQDKLRDLHKLGQRIWENRQGKIKD